MRAEILRFENAWSQIKEMGGLNILNFHLLRGSETQFQVGENVKYFIQRFEG